MKIRDDSGTARRQDGTEPGEWDGRTLNGGRAGGGDPVPEGCARRPGRRRGRPVGRAAVPPASHRDAERPEICGYADGAITDHGHQFSAPAAMACICRNYPATKKAKSRAPARFRPYFPFGTRDALVGEWVRAGSGAESAEVRR